MLQIIFGEDEHTAADGPYNRVLKTRKWLYILACSRLALHNGLYNPLQAEQIIGFIRLPEQVLSRLVIVGLLYLLVQYVLLSLQLLTSYDIVLRERFTFRRADDLASARTAVSHAQQQFRESREAFASNLSEALARRVSELQAQAVVAESDLREAEIQCIHAEQQTPPPSDLRQLRYARSRAKTLVAVAQQALTSVTADPAAGLGRLQMNDDPDVRAAAAALNEAEEALAELRRDVPSERRGYGLIERLIDTGRVGTPMLFAVAAIMPRITALLIENASGVM